MKKEVIMVLMGCALAVYSCTHNIKADTSVQDPVVAERYCVELMDGKMILTQDNKPVTAEITLNDGSKVTTSGMVLRKDGNIIALKTGDCIDKDGTINNTISPTAPIN